MNDRISVGIGRIERAGHVDGAGLEFVVALAAVRAGVSNEHDLLDVFAGGLLGHVVKYILFLILLLSSGWRGQRDRDDQGGYPLTKTFHGCPLEEFDDGVVRVQGLYATWR